MGMGFTFDDECTNGEATSLAEMNRVLQMSDWTLRESSRTLAEKK